MRDYQEEAFANVKKQTTGIRGIKFTASSYLDLDIPPQSTIYCDPPYAGTTKYKDDFDSDKFWQWCREKCKEGHQVFVSEYNAPDDFVCAWQQEVKSSLSANGKGGGTKISTEKLFVHNSQV